MRSVKYASVLLIFILYSCYKNDSIVLQPENKSGVAISFDDDYIDEWNNTHTLLKEYKWKATFYVTKFDLLSSEKIGKLKKLKKYGHEIGGHGLHHLKATEYISINGAEAYLQNEIYPMITLMNSNAFYPTSFAYPYGARNTITDDLLLSEFETLRGTTYKKLPPSNQNCYYNGQKVTYGLGLDTSYPHFSIPYYLSLLEYANKNNKIVIFYAHKPVEVSHSDYETEYATLIQICKYVQLNNMKFYTMSELREE